MLDKRLVIPRGLKKKILRCLHSISAHQGCNGMHDRANLSIYWPGINAEIRNYRQMCEDSSESTEGTSCISPAS